MVKFLQEFAEDLHNMEAELTRLENEKISLLREHALLGADFEKTFKIDVSDFKKLELQFQKGFPSIETWQANREAQYKKELEQYQEEIEVSRSHSTWQVDIPEPKRPTLDHDVYQAQKEAFVSEAKEHQSMPHYKEMQGRLEAIKQNEKAISNVSYHIKDLKNFGKELIDKRSQFYLDTLKEIVSNKSFWKDKGTFVGFMRSEPNTIKELKKILNSNQSMAVKLSKIDSLKYYKLRDKHHDTRHPDLKQLFEVIQSPKKIHDSSTDLTSAAKLNEQINGKPQEEKLEISPRRRSP